MNVNMTPEEYQAWLNLRGSTAPAGSVLPNPQQPPTSQPQTTATRQTLQGQPSAEVPSPQQIQMVELFMRKILAEQKLQDQQKQQSSSASSSDQSAPAGASPAPPSWSSAQSSPHGGYSSVSGATRPPGAHPAQRTGGAHSPRNTRKNQAVGVGQKLPAVDPHSQGSQFLPLPGMGTPWTASPLRPGAPLGPGHPGRVDHHLWNRAGVTSQHDLNGHHTSKRNCREGCNHIQSTN